VVEISIYDAVPEQKNPKFTLISLTYSFLNLGMYNAGYIKTTYHCEKFCSSCVFKVGSESAWSSTFPW